MIEVSPEKIVIVLPDGSKKRFNNKNELERQLEVLRKNRNNYEVHKLVNSQLLIIFKIKDADYIKANEIFESIDFVKEIKSIRKNKSENKISKKIKKTINALADLCGVVFLNIEYLDHYIVLDRITMLMADFTALLRINKKWINKYSYLFNLGWSDFSLLGKLTYIKQNSSDIPNYHLIRTLTCVDILKEMTQLASLVSMIFDIEHRRRSSNFKNFETKVFVDNPALVDEILAEEEKLHGKSKKTQQQTMKSFMEKRKLVINFNAVQTLCRAEKNYQSLIKIKEIIIKLEKYRNKKIFSIEHEAILSLFCLLGEYMTPKWLSNIFKNKKSHVNWQKYIDLRDFIEHQVEKGCCDLIRQVDISKLICDLDVVKLAVNELLSDQTPEEIMLAITEQLKPVAEVLVTTNKKDIDSLLTDIKAAKLKNFCSNEEPLATNEFSHLEEMSELVKQFFNFLVNIQQSVSEKDLEEGRTILAEKLADIDEKEISIKVIDLTKIIERLSQLTEQYNVLLDHFKQEFKNFNSNVVNKSYGKDRKPNKNAIKGLGNNLFADFEDLVKTITRYEKILVEFENAKKRQQQLLDKRQRLHEQKYVTWSQGKDVKPADFIKFVELLKNVNGFDCIEQHVDNNTFPSIKDMQPFLQVLIAKTTDKKEQKFILDMGFTICRYKHIQNFLHNLISTSQGFSPSSPNGVNNKQKVKCALYFLKSINNLLHDKLHDSAFMNKVSAKIRQHRLKGFAAGYFSLTDEDFKVLFEIYEQTNYQNPQALPEEQFNSLAEKYIKSGLYAKLEIAAQKGERQNKYEIIKEYSNVYEQKIHEVLKEDESFELALRYNMKQAILLLHDICNEPAFKITQYLQDNYLELIEKRNYLSHGDDYISQILEIDPNIHVTSIGRVVYVIQSELEMISKKIELDEQQAQTIVSLPQIGGSNLTLFGSTTSTTAAVPQPLCSNNVNLNNV